MCCFNSNLLNIFFTFRFLDELFYNNFNLFLIFFQFIVQASDGSRTANAYVTIKILRNLQTPSFVITSHSATILETQQTGVAINLNPANFDVNDGDRGPPNNQINYRLLNNLDHFQITPQGVVSVKNSLVTSNPRSTSYQVSIELIGDQ